RHTRFSRDWSSDVCSSDLSCRRDQRLRFEIAVFKKDHFKPKTLIATAGPDLGSDFIKAIGGEQYTEGIFVPNGWYPQANNFQNKSEERRVGQGTCTQQRRR